MSKKIAVVFFIIGMLFLSIHSGHAVELAEKGKMIFPDRTPGAIKIDGDLNEEAWSKAPIFENFKTLYPLYGEVLPEKTKVWTAYDRQNLYFAFKCYDREPGKIKTSIARRDTIFTDDFVAVLLDSMGTKQTSYEFYVNPSGVQADVLNSAVSGMDPAPDFVWESAGKLTADGYQVEIRVPLESIRFKSGEEVRMGVIFVRNISRLGTAGAWPETQPGQTDFNFMAETVYRGLSHKLNLEVLPNFTYSRNLERVNPDDWGKDISHNIGVGFKYGISSSITAEATVNPDFSQVESDTFQMEVNQRYPLFFVEKRPFFMERTDVFDFGLVSGGMMFSAVHTRHIADPGWAGKLSGTAGKMSFALLGANDRSPGQAWENALNPDEGKNAAWGIARGKYNFGSDNSLGILYSGRHFAGRHNNVLGADLQYRFFKNARVTLSYLHSLTEEPGGGPVQKGNGLNAMAQYSIPELTVLAAYERYDKNFTMDSAFLNRTGIGRASFFAGPNFYMKIKNAPWIRRIQPYLFYSKLHDLTTDMDDTSLTLGSDLYFSQLGYVKIEYRDNKEAWLGQHFRQKYFYSQAGVQLFKWIYIRGYYAFGDQIYYHPTEPFLGSNRYIRFYSIFQPAVKITMEIDWIHNKLSRKSSGEKVYEGDIVNIHTAYQFNKYFFIRAAVRYDGIQEKLLTDLLASFTLIPGTVIHLGYGSLYEGREWYGNRWIPAPGDLVNMRNGLFFKVSYLWRIK